MGVHHAVNHPGRILGGGDNAGIDAVDQAVYHVRCHLIADVADEQGHRDSGDRVAQPQAKRDRDQADQRPERGQRIKPGMPCVGKEGRRVDAPADNELVPGDYLIADNAQGGPEDPPSDMAGRPVLDQLPDALIAGERRASPDHHGDADARQVLGPVQAIWISFSRRLPRYPEPDEDHRTSRHVRQVMDCVTQQAN